MARLDWYIRANLKLRHLQLLVALDELRNVGRVASYLHVSQPAVSKSLAALESGMRLTLFERTARGMEPTEHGACLIRHARDILASLSRVNDELRDLSEGRVVRVTLGVLPSASVALVPRFIVRLEAEHTDVAATVREGTMDTLLPALRAGDIDLTVGVLPERPLGIEFGTEILYEDPIVAVVRRDHALARRRSLRWEMLAEFPMVLPPANTYTRGAIDTLLAAHGVGVPRRHVESVSTMTNVGTLQLTDSVGFLSRDLARHFDHLGVLSILALDVPNVTMRVGLIWMVERRHTAAQELVRSVFRQLRDESHATEPASP